MGIPPTSTFATYSDSPRNPNRYLGQDYRFAPCYLRNRDPFTPQSASTDTRPKENQGKYPVGSFWLNINNRNLWVLVSLQAGASRNLAEWTLISQGINAGPVLSLSDTANTVVLPSVAAPLGTIQLIAGNAGISITSNPGTNSLTFLNTAAAGALNSLTPDAATAPGTSPTLPNGANTIIVEGGIHYATGTRARPIRTNSLAANTIDIEIQDAGSNPAVSTANNFGVAQFDSNQFLVTAGFVQLKGGGITPALTKLGMNTGTNPIVADATGLISLTGAQVASGVVGANVIRTDGTGANTGTIEIQRSTAVAATDSTKNGVSHFNSGQFTVDGNGFVSLSGGGSAVDSFNTDVAGPVAPDVNGNVKVTGATNIFSDGSVLNTLRLNVQSAANTFLLGAGANVASTTLGPLTNGQVIIGTTAGAPVAANITGSGGVTITNGPGSINVSVSGSGITWSLKTANFVMAPNNGYICIAPGGALTAALPAVSVLGDIIELVLDGATSWQITMGGGQQIRIGANQTSAGGT